MNISKFNALKELGFNYITRDMNGNIAAWKRKPVRSVTVLKGYESSALERFKDANIYDIDPKEDENYSYQDGLNVDFSWFTRSKGDNEDSSMVHLDKSDKDFDDVTWENSPYALDRITSLAVMGFKYITRELTGEVKAWKYKPVRVITCLAEYEETYKQQFKDADVRVYMGDSDEDKDEFDCGCELAYSGFQSCKEDNGDFCNHWDLDRKDYDMVTWENSPYEIK